MAALNIKRFLDAQRLSYDEALNEIRAGRKESHWIWYIFPQLRDLGFSQTSKYYGIKDLDEAKTYLAEPTLRARSIEISEALLSLPGSDPRAVMGYPDDMKLRSSVTLFAAAAPDIPVFQQVLDKYYEGQPDKKTLMLLKM